MRKQHYKKIPVSTANIEIDGKEHVISWQPGTSPAMLAVIASLASLNNPKIVDIFNEFGVHLKDFDGKQIWPSE